MADLRPLTPGQPAPGFQLPDSEEKTANLADFKGRWLVLYFYPRDNTSGCTREAQDFSQLIGEFEHAGASVVGISPDHAASHHKFICNHGLLIRLLSDPSRSVMTAYGVYGEKQMYGKTVQGVIRSTFLIDPASRLAWSWTKVKVEGHAEAVLKKLQTLAGQ